MTRSLYSFRADPERHRVRSESELRLFNVPVHPAAPRLVKRLLAARSAEERASEVGAALQACGFEAYLYGWVGATSAGTRSFCRVDSLGANLGLQRYLDLDHGEIDPRLEPLAAGRPLRWDAVSLQARVAAAREPDRLQCLLDDLRSSGLHSGVVFNVAWPGCDRRYVVISLMSGRSGYAWMSGYVLARALTFGMHMHDFHTRSSTGLWGLDAGAADFAQRVSQRLGIIESAVQRGLERGQGVAQMAARLEAVSKP